MWALISIIRCAWRLQHIRIPNDMDNERENMKKEQETKKEQEKEKESGKLMVKLRPKRIIKLKWTTGFHHMAN